MGIIKKILVASQLIVKKIIKTASIDINNSNFKHSTAEIYVPVFKILWTLKQWEHGPLRSFAGWNSFQHDLKAPQF